MSHRDLAVLALFAATGCKCNDTKPTAIGWTALSNGSGSGSGAVTGAAAPLAHESFFRIDPGPRTPCTAGAECEARLVLTALGDYHVNERYATKLIVKPVLGVSLGKATFALDSAKAGTLTLPYRARRGTHKVTGTFELSVCNDRHCQIESPTIELELTAT